VKNKIIISAIAGTILTLGVVSIGQAGLVDLNTWTAESYPSVSGFGAGSWNVSGTGDSVYQSVNGQPTLFYSDFNSFGSSFTGSIDVGADSDDDFIGFVLGFNPGDSTNSSADYLLIDWKRGTQPYNFGAPSTTPGSTADVGLSVSRVTGLPTADEFWGHTDFSDHTGGGVEELQRAINLGSTGWNYDPYEFTFDFGPNDLEVYVNGVLELDITGSFNDGRFGFYNFSQAKVTYSGFEKDVGNFSVPEPSILALMGFGILGLGLSRRKMKK